MQSFLSEYNIKYFYHFTDLANYESIQKNGLLSLKLLKEKNILVQKYNGTKLSHDLDNYLGISDYVFLSFNKDHPMFYVAKKEQRITKPIWLKIDSRIILKNNVIFSDDIANKRGVNYFNIEQIEEKLDCEVLFSRTNWKDPLIQRRLKSARKSELMIPFSIEKNYILGYENG